MNPPPYVRRLYAGLALLVGLLDAVTLALGAPVLDHAPPGVAAAWSAALIVLGVAAFAVPAVRRRVVGLTHVVLYAEAVRAGAALAAWGAVAGGPQWTYTFLLAVVYGVGVTRARPLVLYVAWAVACVAGGAAAGGAGPAPFALAAMSGGGIAVGLVAWRLRAVADRDRAETALRHALGEAEGARAEAEASARAKSAFLASMSHEIRTPMNGVVGMADLLADTALDDDQAECVATIRTSADALLALINDVLDLSKIEADGVEIEAVPFEPARLAHEAASVLRVQALGRGLALAVEVAGNVPAAVLGDPTRVRQVLLNLLSNAVKFTHQGGVTVRVGAEPAAASGPGGPGWRLRFEVVDTGVGVAADQLDRLFDPFTQADASTTRQYGGTGLGLAISARLVALMGGAVSVQSTPGEGSAFAFTVAVGAASEPADRPAPAPSDAAPPAPSALRVLVAEDNVVNQKVVVRTLARLGVAADVEPDGAAALAAAHRAAGAGRPYDLVLMDVQMPVMDGHEATRRLRAELPAGAQPWVVALTANALEGDREACLAAGADAYLSKPVRREALAAALGAVAPRPASALVS